MELSILQICFLELGYRKRNMYDAKNHTPSYFHNIYLFIYLIKMAIYLGKIT